MLKQRVADRGDGGLTPLPRLPSEDTLGRVIDSVEPQNSATQRPPVDVGWVLAGPMGSADHVAVQQAVEQMERWLEEELPEFRFRMSLTRRREAVVGVPAEPMALLDIGVLERDTAHWDFAFVVTATPLHSHIKPFMLGAPSQALDVAVLSTARLDPGAHARDADEQECRRVIARRVAALAMHLLGHLNDVAHGDAPEDFMFDLSSELQLDGMQRFSESGRQRLRARLAEVADLRLEEREQKVGTVRFYLVTLGSNFHEVLSGIRRIAPWQFPLRYTRLSTAAASTLLVLLVTAEAWELGMSQPGWRVALLSGGSLVGTSYFVLVRQHLLSRYGWRLTEQRVVTTLSVGVSVLLGMLTTYALLFATTWVAAKTLFGPAIVRHWAESASGVGELHYLALAGFVASLGIVIGALGASFEEESYFRRVAMLDEET